MKVRGPDGELKFSVLFEVFTVAPSYVYLIYEYLPNENWETIPPRVLI